MNQIKFFTAIAIFFVSFGLTSCDNEPVDPAIDLNPQPPFIPEVQSFMVNFNDGTYIADQSEAAIFDGQIIINSFKGSILEGFTITIDGTGAGSYQANENTITYSPGVGSTEIYESVNPADPTANTGQITITNVDVINRTLSGNFNFTGYYSPPTGPVVTKSFTNGVFTAVPYTE